MMGGLQIAGAFALLLSFGLLCQVRAGPAAWICALQAMAVTVAMATQGVAAGALPPILAAGLGFALNGVVLPFSTQRHARPAAGWNTGVAVVTATGLVAISLMLSARLDLGSRGEVFGLALSMVLLGLQRMALGPDRANAALGLMAAQNGMLLAAAAIADLPPLGLLAAALPVVPALVVSTVWLQASDAASP